MASPAHETTPFQDNPEAIALGVLRQLTLDRVDHGEMTYQEALRIYTIGAIAITHRAFTEGYDG